MQFTENEITFLNSAYDAGHYTPDYERAVRENRSLRPAIDLRRLGCPDHVYERILESRAKKSGNKFIEFRNQENRLRDKQTQRLAQPEQTLADRVQAAKLW